MRRTTALSLGSLLLFALIGRADELRLNQIQTIGSHNSYHVAPDPALLERIAEVRPQDALEIDYTHRPFAEQFSRLGVRKIELDIFPDPEGGRYANPIGAQLAASPHDPDGVLKKPGLKVLHFPNFDYRTRALTFVQALTEVRDWSLAHPTHCPILILVELKSGTLGQDPPAADLRAACDAIDSEILSVFGRDQLVTPDGVRGEHDTLRDAIRTDGWPLLDEVRGRVLFALDNGGAAQAAYLDGRPSLRGRLLFVSVDASHPAAAFMRINNPVGGFDKIQDAVRQGFLVRTRADAGTHQARENDDSQFKQALASGAQYISTDYPEPDPRFSGYQARLPGGLTVRENPVSGRRDATPTELDTASKE